ncbi:serine hydrolase [Neorhodopirellula pilleata]|uniref:D-alanyl-D-alanine carboxypeptidase n=1 Tax=Neorhodopirellula pilleata TaxID=2714738 RepID=A0A5C6A6V3_9BACT|nr:serine hydrolase [Neorhodopirellula pilleata]TWT95097.1 D-alanyl-D-alanine carboxypeptidase precursor [Neorhodopirellula pilleata]
MLKNILLLCTSVALCSPIVSIAQDAAFESRTWTSADGSFSVDAEFIELKGRVLCLRKANGEIITVALTKISKSDLAYVQERQSELRKSQIKKDRSSTPMSLLRRANVTSLNDMLETVRRKHQIPGMAVAVVQGNQLVAAGAVGLRELNSNAAVTLDDKFHHGSISKPMTSMLIGMLVDRGKLRWDTSVSQAFPDLLEKIRPEYADATIEHLLLHRSGLPSDRSQSSELNSAISALKGDIKDQREQMVTIVLQQPPVAPLGGKYVYANFGFCVAAAMAEAATGESWEDMMTELIFQPLAMQSAGFGPPSSTTEIDQPRGHIGLGPEMKPARATADNAPCMGPSSRVHCNVTDLATFGHLHLRYRPPVSQLLSHATFVRLHTDQLKHNYGLGWEISSPDWAQGELHSHTGTNGMYYSALYVVPGRNLVVAIALNAKSSDACTEVRDLILRR